MQIKKEQPRGVCQVEEYRVIKSKIEKPDEGRRHHNGNRGQTASGHEENTRAYPCKENQLRQ